MKRSLLVVGFLTCLAPRAFAQSSEDKARADTLFEAGKKAMEAGRNPEACGAFADSQKLDPGIGTALRLGDCFRKGGKIASASKAFRQALDMAKAANDKRVGVAERELDTLHPSKLTLAVEAEVSGLEIAVDGAPATERSFAIDGGIHTIVASAPNHEKATVRVDVPAEGADVKATIPKLVPLGGPTTQTDPVRETQTTPPPESPPSSTSSGSGLRIAGIATGGAGIVGLVVGAILGVTALDKWNQSNDPAIGNCDPSTTKCMTQKGIDLRADANTLGTGATVALVAGGILAGAGITLFVISFMVGKKEAQTPQTALRMGFSSVSVAGTF